MKRTLGISAIFAHGILASQIPFTSPLPDGCAVLKNVVEPSKVHFPGSRRYAEETEQYWSKTNWREPPCVLTPSSAKDVSRAVKALSLLEVQFAVRGGGHSTTSFASTDTGVLISLTDLNDISVVNNGGVVRVGGGSRWGDVYRVTDAARVTVVGGKSAAPGVGGLILGGGLGFQSTEHGFACDNVKSYELVTPEGKILNISPSTNSDLFWALKGGSNNFGIVTRFDLHAYPHVTAEVYAGTLYFSPSSLPLVLEKLHAYTTKSKLDRKVSVSLNIIEASTTTKDRSAALWVYYGEAVSSTPQDLSPFFEIPHTHSTVRNRKMSSLAKELADGVTDGTHRIHSRAGSYFASKTLNNRLHEIFHEETKSISSSTSGQTHFSIGYEPITSSFIKASISQGHNTFNLSPNESPQVWYALTMMYTDPTMDVAIQDATIRITERMKREAEKEGMECERIYGNFAAEDQSGVYGEGVREKMRSVKSRWDETRVWERLVEGFGEF